MMPPFPFGHCLVWPQSNNTSIMISMIRWMYLPKQQWRASVQVKTAVKTAKGSTTVRSSEVRKHTLWGWQQQSITTASTKTWTARSLRVSQELRVLWVRPSVHQLICGKRSEQILKVCVKLRAAEIHQGFGDDENAITRWWTQRIGGLRGEGAPVSAFMLKSKALEIAAAQRLSSDDIETSWTLRNLFLRGPILSLRCHTH